MQHMHAATGFKSTQAMAPAASPVVVPFVRTFGYDIFEQRANKRTTTCRMCGARINDGSSTTLNSIRHLKKPRIGQSMTWLGLRETWSV